MPSKINTPLILVNFKTYREASGDNAARLARIIEKVRRQTGVCVGLAPQFVDIAPIAQIVSAPIFAQHVDPIDGGSFTGHVLPQSIRAAGAVGTLINHSERRLRLADIDTAIQQSRKVGLTSVVCTNNQAVSAAVAALKPDMIAVEPPELIGTGVPVSQAQPRVVEDTVKAVKQMDPNIIVLCGAGITKADDVAAAMKLGTEGVLVASGVVKAKDPFKVLSRFAERLTTH
ncbi:MAG: triose-phosphate isomerase [Candidatus Bathyarchaeota archaeon]|nr:MAG: triose-phosphate isomerase [Candidatus Bathyarchaeota archaeon]